MMDLSVVKDLFVMFFILAGAFLSLAASIGVLKFPDLYSRMHASSKAGALGAGCMVAAAAVHFWTLHVAIEAVLVIVFLVLTAPVAAHMIARAGYHSGEAPSWEGSVADDLKRRSNDAGADPASSKTDRRPNQ